MPVGHGELAGDQGGAPAVPIFEDLQQVVARLIIERAKPPVVQDQELDGAQRLEAAAVRRATSWVDSSPSRFNFSISRTRRIVILSVGIGLSQKGVTLAPTKTSPADLRVAASSRNGVAG